MNLRTLSFSLPLILVIVALSACATRAAPDAAWQQRMRDGTTATASGDQAKAESAWRSALELGTALNPHGPEHAASLAALADCLAARGDAQAENVYRQAISACAEAFGADDHNAVTCRDGLARVLVTRQAFDEAAVVLREALAIRERTLGPEHTDTAYSRAMLADVLRAAGRGADAEPLYRQALATWQTLGGNAINRISAEHGLAQILIANRDLAGTRQALQRALALCDEHTAPALRVQLLSELAVACAHSGDLPAAEAAAREALARAEAATSTSSIELVPILDGLTRILAAAGRLDEADATISRAIALSEPHPEQIASLLALRVQLLATAKRWPAAIAANTRLLNLLERSTGTDNRDYVGALNQLIALHTAAGAFAEAAELNQQAIAIVERTLGSKDPNLATALRNGAELLRRAGKADAASLYERRAQAISP